MNPSPEFAGPSVEAATDRTGPSRGGASSPKAPLQPGRDAGTGPKKEPWLDKWLENEEHATEEDEAFNYPFTD